NSPFTTIRGTLPILEELIHGVAVFTAFHTCTNIFWYMMTRENSEYIFMFLQTLIPNIFSIISITGSVIYLWIMIVSGLCSFTIKIHIRVSDNNYFMIRMLFYNFISPD